MKTKIMNAVKLIAVVTVGLVIAGCSDGNLSSEGGQLGNIAPSNSVYIKTFDATPATIDAGQTTTLEWVAERADAVSLTATTKGGKPQKISIDSSKTSNKLTTDPLTETTDFTLIATRQAKAAAPAKTSAATTGGAAEGGQVAAGGEDKRILTVTVKPAGLQVAVTAEPQTVKAGEQSLIKWTVTPADAASAITVTSDSGEEIVTFEKCDSDIKTIIAGESVIPAPAVGCAVVTPAVTTTYTVSALEKGKEIAVTNTVTVTVGDSGNDTGSSSITVNGQKALGVFGFLEPVKVEWTVTPATATVKITSEPEADCTPALEEAKATGSADCILTGETKFHLEANIGGKAIESADAEVYLKKGAGAGLVIPKTWAFENEKISLDIALADKANMDSIQDITVSGKSIAGQLKQLFGAGHIIIKDLTVTKAGVPVVLSTSDGQSVSYDPVRVVPIERVPYAANIVTSLAFDSKAEHHYAGINPKSFSCSTSADGFTCDKAKFFKDGGEQNVEFIESIKSVDKLGSMRTAVFYQAMQEYPTIVAVREGKDDELYMGTTGALMRSTDGGNTWQYIMILQRFADKGVSGDHPTCGFNLKGGGQNVQKGLTADYNSALVSLGRVCDVVVNKNGKVIVATDNGVQVDNSIDTGIAWDPALKTSPLYTHVVNVLESAGDKVFAAADNGVFVSKGDTLGKEWQVFGAISGNVYALAYDNVAKKIYAGTATGVMVSGVDQAAWQKLGDIGHPVIALAVDPNAAIATVIAGTDVGAKITRDGGANWNPIGTLATPVTAVALAAVPVDGGLLYGVSIGTGAGEELFGRLMLPIANQ